MGGVGRALKSCKKMFTYENFKTYLRTETKINPTSFLVARSTRQVRKPAIQHGKQLHTEQGRVFFSLGHFDQPTSSPGADFPGCPQLANNTPSVITGPPQSSHGVNVVYKTIVCWVSNFLVWGANGLMFQCASPPTRRSEPTHTLYPETQQETLKSRSQAVPQCVLQVSPVTTIRGELWAG